MDSFIIRHFLFRKFFQRLTLRNLSFQFSIILLLSDRIFYDVMLEINILFIALSFTFLFDKTFRKKNVRYNILIRFVAPKLQFHRSVKLVKKMTPVSVSAHAEWKNEYSASSITVTTVLSIEDYRFASRDGAAPNGGKETTVISTKRLSFGRDVEEGQRRSKRTIKNALSKTWRAILLAWYF